MGGEPNKAMWRGIRPTDPAENIPVDVKAVTGNVPIIPATPPQNIPVDVKAVTGNVPIIPASPEKVFTRYEVPDGCLYVDDYVAAQNAGEILYTVPNDTVFYLTSMDFSVTNSANARAYVLIRDVGDNTIAFLYDTSVAANAGRTFSAQYPIARKIPEKYDLYVYSSAGTLTVKVHIVGYTRSTL